MQKNTHTHARTHAQAHTHTLEALDKCLAMEQIGGDRLCLNGDQPFGLSLRIITLSVIAPQIRCYAVSCLDLSLYFCLNIVQRQRTGSLIVSAISYHCSPHKSLCKKWCTEIASISSSAFCWSIYRLFISKRLLPKMSYHLLSNNRAT